MKINTDLTKLLNGYAGKWIALSPDNRKIVGVGNNPREALKQARKNKEQDSILTRVSDNYDSLVTLH